MKRRPSRSENLLPTNQIVDRLHIALRKYEFHPAVKLINKRVQVEQRLEHISLQEVVVQPNKLKSKKSCPVGSLPTRLLKEQSPEESQTFLRQQLLYLQPSSIYTSMRIFPCCPSILPMAKHLIYMHHNFPQVRFFIKLQVPSSKLA